MRMALLTCALLLIGYIPSAMAQVTIVEPIVGPVFAPTPISVPLTQPVATYYPYQPPVGAVYSSSPYYAPTVSVVAYRPRAYYAPAPVVVGPRYYNNYPYRYYVPGQPARNSVRFFVR